MKIYEALSG